MSRSDGKQAQPSGLLFTEWPVLWGLAATVLFYTGLPYLPLHRALAVRYFSSHPIEYATTGLFFIGLALLARKTFALGRERRAVALVEAEFAARRSRDSLAESLYDALPAPLRRTVMGERLRDAADHLDSPQSGSLGEHCKYLADLAAERLHGSFALLRTICWAIPILGFLGTVMGITLAIANINPEQLSSSLGDVTGGLAVAFDTTALALALSLVLVFTTFVVERSEQNILDTVEAFALKRLAPLVTVVSSSPFVQAETQAATELIDRTDALIRAQTEVWQGAIESMRTRWAETILEQQGQIRETLATGIEMTLVDHAAGLKAAREELATAIAASAEQFDRTLAQSSRERARQLETFSADLHGLWERCRGDLDDMQERYQQTLASAVAAVETDLREWRGELRSSVDATREHHVELARNAEAMLRVAEQAGELAHLQTRLNDNLESLQATETLQEAVHSLTAATHLLTARSAPRSRAA